MIVKTVKSWSPSARITVALLVIVISLTFTGAGLALIRANSAIDKVEGRTADLDTVTARLDKETKCNSAWKKAYREAQAPRLATQLEALKSTRQLYRNIDEATTPESAHQALKKAYDDLSAQIAASEKFTYPKDECGEDTSTGDVTPKKPFPKSKKETDDAASRETPVAGGGGSGKSGADADGAQRDRGGNAANGDGGGGSAGGAGGNPGTGSPTPAPGSSGSPSFVCSLVGPVCGVVRLLGCCA